MLNIYYGDESIQKEKFIFDKIKGETILLVPDQFSLQAERDALFYLKKKALIDVRVMNFSSLGMKVLNEVGGVVPPLIDKYGRHILLAKIIDEANEGMRVYRGYSWKNSFISKVNKMISEMKRYQVTPDMLEATATELSEEAFLRYKLEDICRLFKAYEESIRDKYLDSEDYITFYGDKILQSAKVAEADVWIYGFDTFSPKNLQVIERLVQRARSVNVVITYDDKNHDNYADGGFLAADDREELFRLPRYIMGRLQKTAENAGAGFTVSEIVGESRKSIWTQEQNHENIFLYEAASFYEEAEMAAAYILKLVEDQCYRFGDIAVVCNDMTLRAGILRRTFIRNDIPVFLDKKRKIMHHTGIQFVVALMEAASESYKRESIISMLKSGLMGQRDDDIELMEKYIKEYNVRGSSWKKEFTRGEAHYGSDMLRSFNSIREEIVTMVNSCKDAVGRYNTAGEKLDGLWRFLEEDFGLRARLEDMVRTQEDSGFIEGAGETAQSIEVIYNIIQQIKDIIGDEKISNSELVSLMTAGFEAVEIGLVPASPDSVMMGTLQRSRMGRIKVLLVIGANEGVLPMDMTDDELISISERETLLSMDMEISKSTDISVGEEQMAIYRTFAAPEEKLYVSYSRMNEKGEAIGPSGIFTMLEEYNDARGGKTVDRRDVPDMDLIRSKGGSIGYVADAFRGYSDGRDIDDLWIETAAWYMDNAPDEISRLRRGMIFDNRIQRLGDKLAEELYGYKDRDLMVSASRLESYSRCPFAHFISYGLRAEEEREFQLGPREVGDIYHHCIMEISEQLTPKEEGVLPTDAASRWMTVTREECSEMIAEIIDREAMSYGEGIMTLSRGEEYRKERIKQVCDRLVWSLIEQFRKGSIKDVYFERAFGRGEELEPIEVKLNDRSVVIRGKIDRMDVLATEDGMDAVRIVDYKTGSDEIRVEQFRTGYKLQLMIYMQAAMNDSQSGESQPIPAGVFYYKIKEVELDAEKTALTPEKVEELINNEYRMEGIVVNDEKTIRAMDKDFDKASPVIPVKVDAKANGYKAASGGIMLAPEEFEQLRSTVEQQVERICREITDGKIDIEPKIDRKKDMAGQYITSCRYCSFRSVCLFDTAFDGCRYKEMGRDNEAADSAE